jgi:hypothetical protein
MQGQEHLTPLGGSESPHSQSSSGNGTQVGLTALCSAKVAGTTSDEKHDNMYINLQMSLLILNVDTQCTWLPLQVRVPDNVARMYLAAAGIKLGPVLDTPGPETSQAEVSSPRGSADDRHRPGMPLLEVGPL